jgi:uncharacterized glyoxalase superfamily protein PhnB
LRYSRKRFANSEPVKRVLVVQLRATVIDTTHEAAVQLHTYLNYGGDCEEAFTFYRTPSRREDHDVDAAWQATRRCAGAAVVSVLSIEFLSFAAVSIAASELRTQNSELRTQNSELRTHSQQES